MVQMYGYRLRLCSLCVTQWKSVQACFASLLRLRYSYAVEARKHDSCLFPVLQICASLQCLTTGALFVMVLARCENIRIAG